ncbi:hypothetical protein FKW77_002455 [Venturia effusa]|uniref:Uncharacterized protein n=1 Tax=Venturia effusa TaxID=50376 RepID=A0A517L6U8_9PEZI|nr:hypothetical protein FKW77_002455 [Venturia effusa]
MSSTSIITNNTPSNPGDCFKGNADFYGFGIRLGTYLQFLATLLVTLYAPKAEDFYRALNNLLQTAMFAGLIVLTRTQKLLVIEPVIVIFLLFGGLSSLTGEDFSPIGRPSGMYRLLLYSGIAGYSCWFWFKGIDFVASSSALPECKTTVFFGQVSPYGGFRTFNKVASVLGLILCGFLLPWSIMKSMKNGGSRMPSGDRTTDVALVFYSSAIIIVSINGVGQIIPLLVGALGMIETLKDVLLGVFGESGDIKAMIGYLYTIDPARDSTDVFGRYARLYIAADFYDIASLRTHALQMLGYYACDESCQYLNGIPGRKDFIATIKLVYETDGDDRTPLRRIVACATAQRAGSFLSDRVERTSKAYSTDFDIDAHLQEVMLAYPEFARNVALASGNIMRTTEQKRTRYQCPQSSCRTEWAIENDPKGKRGNHVWCPHCGAQISAGANSWKAFRCLGNWVSHKGEAEMSSLR